MKKIINQRETELRKARDSIKSLNTAMKTLQNKVTENTQLQQEIETQKKLNQESRVKVCQSKTTIQQQKGHIAKQNEQISKLREVIGGKDEEINKKNQEIYDKDQQIAELKKRMTERFDKNREALTNVLNETMDNGKQMIDQPQQN